MRRHKVHRDFTYAPTRGGGIRQVTHLKQSVQAQFNISPDGKRLAAIADNSIWLVDIQNGESARITGRVFDEEAPVAGVLWSNMGNILVNNRYVKGRK